MNAIGRSGDLSCFGTTSEISVTRGLAEFHARRPVQMTASGESVLVLPVDGLDAVRLAVFRNLCAPAVPRLVITAQRARALGIDTQVSVDLPLDAKVEAQA